MARGLQDLQNLLPVQILVLCSLGLQVILFLCAGVRRTETSGGVQVRVRVLLLWLAYNSGDILATYTLARLSFFSTAGEHPLVALWAPFLLLHLAGPDNIAAYALQDNQLWLRSLQTFFSQVTAGGYFLYTYSRYSSSGGFLRLASRLMFAVGVVKYGERWLALQRGNLGSIRDSLKKQPPASMIKCLVHPQDETLKEVDGIPTLDEESSVRRAHSLFQICKCGMVDSSEDEHGRQNYRGKMKGAEYWTIVEIELSFIEEDRRRRHREVDAAMTYVLFGSALFMEWIFLLNALGSSWMFATLSTTRSPWLRYKLLCSGRWNRLRRLVVSLHSLATCGGARRRWSGNMGQYNMLHFCARPSTLLTRPLLGRLAELVGLGELWNRKHFSGAIKMSDHVLIKKCINKHTQLLYTEGMLNTLGMINHHQWGMTALVRRHKTWSDCEKTFGVEFQEGIIIWHIGTDFFLSKCKRPLGDLVKAIKALSNYMMFLLVERRYMLPGIAQNRLYERTCKALEEGASRHCHPTTKTSFCAVLKGLFRWRDDPTAGYTSRAISSRILAENLYDTYVVQDFRYETVRLTYSATVAKQLLLCEKEHGTTESLELVLEVWTDMLVYAANKCSRESHAKKLGSGGELTTIVWLIVEHFHQAGLDLDGSSKG